MLPTTNGPMGSAHHTPSVTWEGPPLAPVDARDASTPAAVAPVVAAPAAPEVVRAAPRPIATARPWYRREPWLGVTLASFAPIGAGFATPQQYHHLLLGLSGVLVILSTALLIRQGPFREQEPPVRAPRRERGAMPALSEQLVA
jgi:hypothetical protein